MRSTPGLYLCLTLGCSFPNPYFDGDDGATGASVGGEASGGSMTSAEPTASDSAVGTAASEGSSAGVSTSATDGTTSTSGPITVTSTATDGTTSGSSVTEPTGSDGTTVDTTVDTTVGTTVGTTANTTGGCGPCPECHACQGDQCVPEPDLTPCEAPEEPACEALIWGLDAEGPITACRAYAPLAPACEQGVCGYPCLEAGAVVAQCDTVCLDPAHNCQVPTEVGEVTLDSLCVLNAPTVGCKGVCKTNGFTFSYQPRTCGPAGTCVAEMDKPCGAFKCGDNGCNTQCMSNTECIAGATCNNGFCKFMQP